MLRLFCCVKAAPDAEKPSKSAAVSALSGAGPSSSAAAVDGLPRLEDGSSKKNLGAAVTAVVRRKALNLAVSGQASTSDTGSDEDEISAVGVRGRILDPRSLAELHRALGVQAVNRARAATNIQEARAKVERLAEKRPYLFAGLPPGVHPCDWQREEQVGELDELNM